MNNILIVDDEPIIVQGLFDVLRDREELELSVWKAFSAEEAIDVMNHNRVDILITDIQMGEMNGLELTRIVRNRWSRCKIIFLTGYAHVEYLQFALRQGAYDYLVKPVDDEKIIEAVQGVLAEIKAERKSIDAIEKASLQIRQAQPVLQQEFLSRLLAGLVRKPEQAAEQFHALNIPLRAEDELAVMVGRVDRWPNRLTVQDQTLLQYAIGNIVDEFCSPVCRMSSLTEGRYLIWLIQTAPDRKDTDIADLNKLHWYIGELLEQIQQSVRQVLDLPFSIVFSQPNVAWTQLPRVYGAITELFLRGIGLDEEIIMIDRPEQAYPNTQEQQLRYHDFKNSVSPLRSMLENGEEQRFTEELYGLMQSAQKSVFLEYSLQLELFCTLSAMFLSFVNKRKLTEQLGDDIQLELLSNFGAHRNWPALTAYYLDLTKLIFQYARSEETDEKNEIVRKVDDYIASHLDGDLSLNNLAKQVHLSPFYLSRLYQKQKGYSLSQYIVEVKLEKARQLLLDPEAKVQDVALQLGFDNVPYFAKFFKKQTGMSPQKYRREQ